MTSVLSDLQADYERRAREALQAPVSLPAVKQARKATRTYTGQALARRQAWGKLWGSILKAHAHELRNEANQGE